MLTLLLNISGTAAPPEVAPACLEGGSPKPTPPDGPPEDPGTASADPISVPTPPPADGAVGEDPVTFQAEGTAGAVGAFGVSFVIEVTAEAAVATAPTIEATTPISYLLPENDVLDTVA